MRLQARGPALGAREVRSQRRGMEASGSGGVAEESDGGKRNDEGEREDKYRERERGGKGEGGNDRLD